MEKNEVGCVVVCVKDNYIRICKVLPPQKFRKLLRHQKFYEFRILFGIGACNAEFACPLKIQKGRKKEDERGLEDEIND